MVRLITLHGRLLENLLLKHLELLLKKEHLSGINHSWWHRWRVSTESLLTLVRNFAGAPLAIVLVELVPRQAVRRLVLGCRGLAYGNEIAARLLLLRFWQTLDPVLDGVSIEVLGRSQEDALAGLARLL